MISPSNDKAGSFIDAFNKFIEAANFSKDQEVMYLEKSKNATSYNEKDSYNELADIFRKEHIGLIKQSAMMLCNASDMSYAQGNYSEFLRNIDKAIKFANDHGLEDLQFQFQLKKYRYYFGSDPSREILQEFKDKLATLRAQAEKLDSIAGNKANEVELNLAETKYIEVINESPRDKELSLQEENPFVRRQRKKLAEAKDLARGQPVKFWATSLDLSDFYEQNGNIKEAILNARDAVDVSETMDFPIFKIKALAALSSLLLKANNIGERERIEAKLRELPIMDLNEFNEELEKSLNYYKIGDFENALKSMKCAQKKAPNTAALVNALTYKAEILESMRQKEKALTAIEDALKLVDGLFSADSEYAEWKNILEKATILSERAAFLSADLGMLQNAFKFADGGKARRLRMRIAEGRASDSNKFLHIPDVTFEDVQGEFLGKSLGIIMFCMSKTSTLLIILDPGRSEPQCICIDGLNKSNVDSIIPVTKICGGETLDLFKSLPKISKMLLPHIREVSQRCNTLCIVPDSNLNFVPFAALTFEDGTSLIERCALFYMPSVSLLKWYFTLDSRFKEHDYLALAFGQENDIFFDKQAEEIIVLFPGVPKTLLGKMATKENLLNEITHHDVVHISCHGRLEASYLGTSRASQLELYASDVETGEKFLTAKEIADLESQLHADLVFLNACSSGLYQLSLGGELGGFIEAFLNKGARSIIATLYSVDPSSAHDIALNFYKAWLKKKVNKAEALKCAQLSVKKEKPDPRHWASHILMGDPR